MAVGEVAVSSLSSEPKAFRWVPSISDFFFASVLYALFGRHDGWASLLTDADCGWHIRTGEYILTHGSVPSLDLFSFSRAGAPWFAWEWLSDVILALLYRAGGLPAVTAAAGAVIGVSVLILWCWLLRRGAGLFIALPVTLVVAGASTVHYLARPHIFSILFFTVGLWILTSDRRTPTRAVWWLVPMTALWTNLHGGFVAWPATVAVAAVVDACGRNFGGARRYGLLAAACSGATVVNPYGLGLHGHIAAYLRSSWIANSIQEFQSPQFRSENVLLFGLLLVSGLVLASRAWMRGERFESVLVCLWACAALRSARHIPLYCIAAAPVIAGCWSQHWKKQCLENARGIAATTWQVSQDFARTLGRPTPWLVVLATVVFATTLTSADTSDFPSTRFPTKLVSAHQSILAPPDKTPRVLTTDQWADYLIYRFYPRVRVFFDGRSDFYGPEIGERYRSLMMLTGDWRSELTQQKFQAALLPLDWPLRVVLESDPGWQKIDSDRVAVLFVRKDPTHGD